MLASDLEGVLGVARGMVGREVERLEVVEVALDLRAEVGGVAQVMEDAHDLMHGLKQRMRDAGAADGSGERDVDSLHCRGRFCGAAGASRACSICCLSWLKRMPRGLRASAGADLSQASEMSLRRPCLRPSQWRRKFSCDSALASEAAPARTSSARVAKAVSSAGSS